MNLILALFWLIVGVGMLLMPWLDPEGHVIRLGQAAYLGGGTALMLVVYNLLRWWSSRAFDAGRRTTPQTPARRRPEDEDPARPTPVRDPNFDFTERPPS